MSFQATYAGVELAVCPPDFAAWIDAFLPLNDVPQMRGYGRWPGHHLAGVAWADPGEFPPARVGQFWWPSGAARYAIARFLVSGEQLKRIRDVCFQGSSFNAANLVLRCGDGNGPAGADYAAITARMYCLPPRPLSGAVGSLSSAAAARDPYLLTLVDQRYYWRQKGVTINSGSWTDAIAACEAALGISLDTGEIEDVYGEVEPDSDLPVYHGDAAVALDAVLANVGRTLIADYDGATFLAPSYADALIQVGQNLAAFPLRSAGGEILSVDASASNAFRRAVLPSAVTVSFPKWVEGQGGGDQCPNDFDGQRAVPRYATTVEVGGLAGYGQYVSSAGPVRVFRDSAKAVFGGVSDSTPANIDDLRDLAERLAMDFIDAQLGIVDQTYGGVVPWLPDGINDVLIHYRPAEALTRVSGRPAGVWPVEFQHGFPAGGSGSGSGEDCDLDGFAPGTVESTYTRVITYRYRTLNPDTGNCCTITERIVFPCPVLRCRSVCTEDEPLDDP